MICAAILISASVYVNFFLGREDIYVPRQTLSSIPKTIDGWESTDQSFTTQVLENLGVDEYLMRRYTKKKDTIWLYVGYYKSQKEGAVPHSPRNCYPGSGFSPIHNDIVAIPVKYPGKQEIRPNRYIFSKGFEREIVIYWYQSRGRVIADEYMEKLYLVRDAIFRDRTDGALVRLSTTGTRESEEVATNLLANFISDLYPSITRAVPD